MAERLPDDAELLFVETIRTGTVHLHVKLGIWHRPASPSDREREEPRGGAAFVTVALSPVVVRCGERTWPTDPDERRHRWTTEFADDRLCAGCHRTLHTDDQHRAFEHDQPPPAAASTNRPYAPPTEHPILHTTRGEPPWPRA